VKGILVSQLDELQVPKYVGVDDAEVVVNCSIKHHMVGDLVDLLTRVPYLFTSIQVNELLELIGLIVLVVQSMNKRPEEVDHLEIVVVDAEEQAVEQGRTVYFDVARVVRDALNDVNIQMLGRLTLLLEQLAQSVDLLEPVGHLVVEVYIFFDMAHHHSSS